ncbi:MAG: type II toxin-antitoxin system RelE/ParE family toxin [Thermoguttaceae bacterium]
MKRLLLRSDAFIRAAKKLVKKRPSLGDQLQTVLTVLEEDAFAPALKTHKLKGDLAGLWSCSINFELRIVFEFVQHQGSEAILLETIGTHDEVY